MVYTMAIMDPYSLSTIGLFALLLVFCGFFAGSETAFSSVNKIKLKHLAQEGNRKASLALAMTDKFDRLLSTLLIGINIANILAASMATVFFVGYFGNIGASIATAVTTVLVLIFGEISPKIMAKETPERFAMLSVQPMRFFMFVFTPINYLSAQWKKTIVKLFHIHSDNKVTEAELLTFVEEVRQVGGINEGEERMIRSAIEFDDLTVNDILTPRVDVAAVSIDDAIESIEKCFYETGYSRLPVYRGSIDSIIGVILLKDFLRKIVKTHEPLDAIVKPVVFTNATTKINRLLKSLQAKKTHLAVVLDEFGGTVGIVTMEDIVEELVGEIWDEHEEAAENIVPLAQGAYRIKGNTPLRDFCETLNLDERDISANSSTVGGWVNEYLGEIPEPGFHFTFKDFSIVVLEINHNRIMEITVSPERPPPSMAGQP
jgi:CBS domain containing-hemolysin-like protein